MGSPEETNLTNAAVHHARRLQWLIAAIAFAFACIIGLIAPLAQAALETWGLSNDTFVFLVYAPFTFVMSIYASWSAVWIALGSGRWLSRMTRTLVIFHVAVIFIAGVGLGVEAIHFSEPAWRDMLALVSASSYAFAVQVGVSMLFVWPLRYRLLYFDQPASYPHPRAIVRRNPIQRRTATTVLSCRVHLADLFVLTSLIAVYMAAWYPIVDIALNDDRMFGAPFRFFVVLVVLAISSGVGLLVVLLPLVIAMLDRRGKHFQVVCQSVLLLVICVLATIIAVMNRFDEEIVGLCICAIITFLANQVVLYLVLHKPSRWFRFRLVRATA